jgi:hypothetical protein
VDRGYQETDQITNGADVILFCIFALSVQTMQSRLLITVGAASGRRMTSTSARHSAQAAHKAAESTSSTGKAAVAGAVGLVGLSTTVALSRKATNKASSQSVRWFSSASQESGGALAWYSKCLEQNPLLTKIATRSAAFT